MTQKRTFSLPDDVAQQLDAASAGNASSFVTAALREKLQRDEAAQRLKALYGDPDPAALAYWMERFAAGAGEQLPGQRAS